MERKTLFVYSWAIDPSEENITSIRVYGLGLNNENICLLVKDFTPYVYVELPNDISWDYVKAQYVADEIDKRLKDHKPLKKSLHYMKRLYYANYDMNTKDIRKYPYLFMNFSSKNDIRELVYLLRKDLYIIEGNIGKIKLKVHEDNATPILQLTCRQNIPTAGWVDFGGKRVEKSKHITTCDEEYVVSWRTLTANDRKQVAKPLIMGYDIEAYSSVKSAMPDAKKTSDCIFQISCVFHRFNEPESEMKKVLISLGSPRQDVVGSDTRIIECLTEAQLLDAFSRVINEYNPNLITGYNIFCFDIPYMIDRSSSAGSKEFYYQGFLKDKASPIKEIEWSSSAFKRQKFKFLDTEGRIFVDLLQVVRRNYKFDNYRLKTVSEALVGESKDPLTHKGIFRCYEIGFREPCDRANGKEMTFTEREKKVMGICGKYCVQDSVLVIRLMNKMHTWIDLTELAKTCNVPIFTLYTQGQQIRVFSQIYKNCTHSGYVVERDVYKTRDDEHYIGATVIDPIPGLYEVIIPLDFSSLYPSIIIGKNIDYSTLVTDDNIPNRMCNVIEWSEHCGCEHDTTKRKTKPKNKLCGDRKFRFLKEPKGIMPTLLENLLTARKETKKEIKEVEKKMKELTDEKEIKELELYLSVLDKRQLAFKVCANSGYGAMGVREGYLPFMPGAMCTTAVGRQSIETVAKYIPEHFNGKIVYGDTDSNYVHFPDMEGKPISEIWEHAIMVARETSKLFPKPMKLEFEEKIYTKFLILTKKRYMCLSCKEDGIVSEKIDKKGVLLARRDNSKAIRDIYSNIIMKIFHKQDEDTIIYELIQVINKLCSGVLSPKDFVITKSVGDVNNMEITDISTTYKKGANSTMKEIRKGKLGDYVVEMLSNEIDERKRQLELKNADNDGEYYLHCLPAQVQLAQKMRRRGQIVDVGSRIEYVVITDGTVFNINKEKQYEKLEDIVYYMNHSDVLQIDHLYYLKALSNPMDQVLNIICQKSKNFVLEQYKYRLHRVKVLAELKALFNPVLLWFD